MRTSPPSADNATVIPRATYRLQLGKDFGFAQAAQLAPYLQSLGVSHLYLSPCLKSRPGSAHGYDIVDHSCLDPELGGEPGFEQLTQTARAHGLGLILDFVPNHMGVAGADNPLWLDVLEWGESAEHADWFDIDWDPERRYLRGKVLAPLLADQYGVELERGSLQLKFDAESGGFAVWAYNTHKLPICPPHYQQILGDEHIELERLGDAFAWLPKWRLKIARRAAELRAELAALVRERADVREALEAALSRYHGTVGDAASWQRLDQLIAAQNWRVAHYRVAADDINYRRFFNINDLAGLRVELPEVFDHAHQRILRLVRDGSIDGLRIDHIDGLFDPREYLRRLNRRIGARRQHGPLYLVVEKILAAHEQLREEWPVAGTTGYDFLNQVTDLLIDSAAEQAFTSTYASFTGELRGFAEIVPQAKREIMRDEMAGELNVLARDIARLARQNPRTADFTQNLLRRAIGELIACFPVYRTYLDSRAALDAADQRNLSWALAQVRRSQTGIDPSVFEFLEQVLTAALIRRARSGFSRQALLRCAQRLQQYSGPVMAKGLEDTAYYRYQRFISLNEVGGDPARFGSTIAAFHHACAQRAQRWPRAMLATSTHDTKRGEDARARLAALAEFHEEWARQLPIWTRILRGPSSGALERPQPDHNDEYLFYQLLLGSWPSELLDADAAAHAGTSANTSTSASADAEAHAQPDATIGAGAASAANAATAPAADATAHPDAAAAPQNNAPASTDVEVLRTFAERVQRTLVKCARESRAHTSWSFPNPEYEQASTAFVEAALVGARAGAFLPAFLPLARRIAAAGAHNSLVQTAIKLTAPGMPDQYGGSELWDLSMVDPDNRRAIDYELRARRLADIEAALRADRAGAMAQLMRDWRDGGIKLAVMVTLLRHRAGCSELYASGDYLPLPASGPQAEQLCAFARMRSAAALIVAAARFPRRLEQQGFEASTLLPIPDTLRAGSWQELLTGRSLAIAEPGLQPTRLFETLPIAVLYRAAPEGA